MQALARIIKPRKSIPLSLLHTTTLSPPRSSAPANPAAYDKLVYEAGRSGDLRLVHRLLIKRINAGCFNTKDTFNFITNTQSSITQLPNLFDCLANLPKGLPRKGAFDALINRLCKLGLLRDALQVLDEMRNRELELNACSFHPVINALCKKKEMGSAVRVLDRMKAIRVLPDVTAYNYVLTAYCAKGEVESAADLLGRMVAEEGIEGDARTYDAMVLGACRAGDVAAAVAVVRAAVEVGVKMVHSTYGHVIKAVLEERLYDQAVKFVMSFAGRDRGVDIANFELLGNELIKMERFGEAKMVVSEMKRRGLPMGQGLRDFYQLHSGYEV